MSEKTVPTARPCQSSSRGSYPQRHRILLPDTRDPLVSIHDYSQYVDS